MTSKAYSLLLPVTSLVFIIAFWGVGITVSYLGAFNQDANMTDCLVEVLA